MNLVGELLRIEDIHLDLDVPDKAALLDRVGALLAARVSLPRAQIVSSLRAREQLGSTALGHGVAFPHARIAQCDAAAGVYVRTKMPIAFDAPDHVPVSHILALIVPKQATERHLRLLAGAAAMFGDPKFRDALAACRDPRAVHQLFVAWPPEPVATPRAPASPPR